MAYDLEDLPTQISEDFGLSPTDESRILDFLGGLSDDELFAAQVFDQVTDEPVRIEEGVEVARIEAGGTYETSGQPVLLHVDSEEDVQIDGRIVSGGTIVIISGKGRDFITVSSDEVPLAASEDGSGTLSPGAGLVLSGEGDDTVMGGSGGDSLGGQAGDDVIMAGLGDDTLSGGAGSDTLDGAGGFDQASYDGDRIDFDVSANEEGLLVTHGETGDADTLIGVEYVSFGDGSVVLGLGSEAQADVARVYEVAFDRAADADGLKFWLSALEGGVGLDQIAQHFVDSPEFQELAGDDLSDVAFVEAIYGQGLGREGDAEGVAFWSGLLEEGAITRAELLGFFAVSDEAEEVFDYVTIIPDFDLG
jgi:Ca2+-binding RTX toxin-like protein